MAEINYRSCHKGDDDDNSDLSWLIPEELLFPMVHVYGADY
jgi:hypothetical protein